MPDDLKVFIVGSPRSGTSITYYAMQEVMGLAGYGESHVFPIFQQIIHQFHEYSQNFSGKTEITASYLDTKSFRNVVLQYIVGFYENIYATESWVDKTPGGDAIQGVPVILQAFPSAKIIIPRRTGIEAVSSILRKFSVPFRDACTIWDVAARETLGVRRLELDVLEVDQFDMTNKPDDVGKTLTSFLGRPEKAAEMAQFFASKRTDQLSHHDWTRRLTLDETRWSDEEKRIFHEVCGAMMHAFGYPM